MRGMYKHGKWGEAGIKELVTHQQTAGWLACLTEPCT